MKIDRIRIRNFRCLDDVEVAFDSVTTFLGPNGAGKSTILHALDWFFNGGKGSSLSIDDVFQQEPDRVVSVSVTFDELSPSDRVQLGKYAPESADNVTIWKQWDDGVEKVFGRGRTFGPFDAVRAGASAAARKAQWNELRSTQENLVLPSWSNDAAVATTMNQWEADHPDELEDADVESTTHFFGFAGQAVMSGLFDFIFVSADLRAGEEAMDGRSAVVGRILEQAIDRKPAETEVADLVEGFAAAESEVHQRNFGDQLKALSDELTVAVTQFTSGRSITLSTRPEPVKPQRIQFSVGVIDADLETSVDRQGHGFQRALLIAALKTLAEHGRGDAGRDSVICLAVEEPELFQHPLQARSFAAVLRSLAEDARKGVQIAYATHSPYFIEAKCFHQIRRVTRRTDANGRNSVEITGSTIARIVERLDGYLDAASIERQLDGVCLGGLAEGFFADVVLIVEGTTDRAVLTGAAARDSVPLLLEGIFVSEAGGKARLLLPYVILDEIGIPAYIVADNDSHLRDQLADLKASPNVSKMSRPKDLKNAVTDSIKWNRLLLRFFDIPEEDWPTGSVAPNFTFVDGGLEHALADMWPSWAEARQALIDEGMGFAKKNSSTYEEAALRAEGEVPELLTALLDAARSLKAA